MTTDLPEHKTAEPQEAPAGGPGEPGEVKERKHFEINVYRDWCKGCGICAALCPKQVLTPDEEGRPVVTDPDACIGCGWCELHCPDFAISVRPRLEKKEGKN